MQGKVYITHVLKKVYKIQPIININKNKNFAGHLRLYRETGGTLII